MSLCWVLLFSQMSFCCTLYTECCYVECQSVGRILCRRKKVLYPAEQMVKKQQINFLKEKAFILGSVFSGVNIFKRGRRCFSTASHYFVLFPLWANYILPSRYGKLACFKFKQALTIMHNSAYNGRICAVILFTAVIKSQCTSNLNVCPVSKWSPLQCSILTKNRQWGMWRDNGKHWL